MEKLLKFFAMALVIIGAIMFIPNAGKYIFTNQVFSALYFCMGQGLMGIGMGIYFLKLIKKVDLYGKIIGWTFAGSGLIITACLFFVDL